MDGLIQQNSLLISLLAGNLVQRPVRNGLHRQPGSAVSGGYVPLAKIRATFPRVIGTSTLDCANDLRGLEHAL
jgi:hypothetical protein